MQNVGLDIILRISTCFLKNRFYFKSKSLTLTKMLENVWPMPANITGTSRVAKYNSQWWGRASVYFMDY